MKTNKKVLLTVLAITTLGSSFASAFALTNVGASNVSFSIRGTNQYDVTYYIPNPSSSDDYETLEEKHITVSEGTLISEISFVKDNTISGFTFNSWNSADDFGDETVVTNSTAVTSDITLYAEYNRENVLYFYNGEHNYLTETNANDQTLTQQYYFVGTQTFAKAGVSGSSIDLTSNGGYYKFTLSQGTWSCLRRIDINLKDVTWWTGDGAVTKLWCHTSDSKSDAFTEAISFTDNKASVYVDYSYKGFNLARLNPSDLSVWWNQTIDISLTADSGEGAYSNVTPVIFVGDGEGQKPYYRGYND